MHSSRINFINLPDLAVFREADLTLTREKPHCLLILTAASVSVPLIRMGIPMVRIIV